MEPAVLATFRVNEVVQSFSEGGSLRVIDSPTTPLNKLEHIATLLPGEWLAPSATGTAEQWAESVQNQLDLGADGVIMHGASPAELEPIVGAYRAIRSLDPVGCDSHAAQQH